MAAPATDKPGVTASTIKTVNLALQGGGAHGAFTWGVLDRFFEDGRIGIEGICGTSAGAMNAVVTAEGLRLGGPARAREKLASFWSDVADAARSSPLRPTPLDKALSVGNMDFSPFWLWYDGLSRIVSPYQVNPLGFNPLKPILEQTIDFDALRACPRTRLFVCATNVKSGRIKVFDCPHISLEAVLASACLPFLFQAVEVDGEHYWDGGFMGNPPIYPLIYNTACEDVLVIQINPINIDRVPTSAVEILDRMNDLSFNSSLMREMRTIHFVRKLLEEDRVERGRYKKLRIHTVDAEKDFAGLNYSSKLNADLGFQTWLFELGREKGQKFLDTHFDAIGNESSTDIAEKFL